VLVILLRVVPAVVLIEEPNRPDVAGADPGPPALIRSGARGIIPRINRLTGRQQDLWAKVVSVWSRTVLAGGGLGQPGPADPGLDVSHPLALEVNLHLVLLDVPVADSRDPSERALTARHDSLTPVEDVPDLARRQPLLLRRVAAAEPQDLVVGCFAGSDSLECLWRGNGPARPPPTFASSHLDARPQRPDQTPHERSD